MLSNKVMCEINTALYIYVHKIKRAHKSRVFKRLINIKIKRYLQYTIIESIHHRTTAILESLLSYDFVFHYKSIAM